MFANPTARLICRALLAGVAVLVTSLQTTGLTHSGLIAAAVAASWAVVEYLTPINQLVGPSTGGPTGGPPPA